MRPLSLVFLVGDSFDITPILARALVQLGGRVDVVKVPHFLMASLDSKNLNMVRTVVRQRSADEFVVFCPDTTELFLEEADFMILFSAYRSWFRPEKARVIPHLWTPVKMPQNIDQLTWSSKPSGRISFMGRTHAGSRLTRVMLRSPKALKEWLLRGSYLRFPRVIAWLGDCGISIANINTFPRVEALRILQEQVGRHPSLELDIVERARFGGTVQELTEYKSQLAATTYVICPRGSENYSFRMYEALSFGRVPVIVDTDMILPPEIDWDRVAIRVPYAELGNLCSVIAEDYLSKSETAFMERQQLAFASMRTLQSFDWIYRLADRIVSLSQAAGAKPTNQTARQ